MNRVSDEEIAEIVRVGEEFQNSHALVYRMAQEIQERRVVEKVMQAQVKRAEARMFEAADKELRDIDNFLKETLDEQFPTSGGGGDSEPHQTVNLAPSGCEGANPSRRTTFGDLQPGDRFRVVVECEKLDDPNRMSTFDPEGFCKVCKGIDPEDTDYAYVLLREEVERV